MPNDLHLTELHPTQLEGGSDEPDHEPPSANEPNQSLSLAAMIARLASCDLPALRQVWQDNWGDPPPLRAVDLLRLMIAWRLQAEAEGGLDRLARRQLARRGRVQPEGQELGEGTRLRREWQGRLVEVVVTDKGFRWEEKVYPSLSAAATAIAGTRWNGPRFFGLRGAAR